GGMRRFSAAMNMVGEAAGQARIHVSRTGGAVSGVTVQYTTSDGTAVAGTDYTATSGTLTFGAGEATKTFVVTVLDNDIADGDRSLNLTLLTPGRGGVLGVPSTMTLTITDDVVGVRFSAASYTVSEAGGMAPVSAARRAPAPRGVTVQYATSDGTATAGADYRAVTGTLTFGAGVTSKTFTVPII